MSFIFGGDTGMTYEQVQRNRKIAEQLMAGSGRSKNVGEGIGSFAKQISGALIQRKADKRDDALRGEADELWNSSMGNIFGGGGSSAATPSPYSAAPPPVSTAPLPTEADLLGNDAMAAIGRTPNNPTVPPATSVSTRGAQPSFLDLAQQNIFPGESGGDYDALFGYSNRDGGRFSGVQLTNMTVDQALDFSKPSGEYGQHVKGEVGRVATPMGAYQVVGTTLRAAKDGLGLTGNETMTPELQDRIGEWIYQNQGPGAWEAWGKGGGAGGGGSSAPQRGGQPNVSTQQIVELLSNPYIRQDPAKSAVLQSLLQQNMQGQDPMRALELERAQLELEQLRNPQADPWANTKVIGDQIVTMQNGQPQVIADLADPPKPEVPTTKNVTLDDGSEVMVQWNPETRVWDAAPIPEGGTTGTGGNANLTEGQSKLTLFQTLQTETSPVLVSLEEQFNPANFSDPAKARIPIAGNYFASPEYQMYQTAASAWAEGALRIATGAAATQPEIERNIKTYFAQPGDTPQTVAFKAQMREMYARAVNNALGAPSDGGSLPIPTPEAFAEQVGGPDAGGGDGAPDLSGMSEEELRAIAEGQ